MPHAISCAGNRKDNYSTDVISARRSGSLPCAVSIVGCDRGDLVTAITPSVSDPVTQAGDPCRRPPSVSKAGLAPLWRCSSTRFPALVGEENERRAVLGLIGLDKPLAASRRSMG